MGEWNYFSQPNEYIRAFGSSLSEFHLNNNFVRRRFSPQQEKKVNRRASTSASEQSERAKKKKKNVYTDNLPHSIGQAHFLNEWKIVVNFHGLKPHIESHVLWSCNLSSPKNFKIQILCKRDRLRERTGENEKKHSRKQTVCVYFILHN